ncbi:hypothetical protein [Paenibacillus puerhi]|uniref:hypothetical protein n=1 Tax=Paenibacillus puerhi TaxID=2692622 RepID=UPI00135BAEFF|nr:hypothetical protein [Paenibacillus puerhi]
MSSNDVNWGKYKIPPTLQILIDLDRELTAEGKSMMDGLKFNLTGEGYRYFSTPCDVVVFGSIGVDGIHYGFLTDFGSVSDLEQAPIVCVSPMDFDQPTQLIAANLRDFLRVNLTDDALFYNRFADEQTYLVQKKEWEKEANHSPYVQADENKRITEEVISRLRERIVLPDIENPFMYMRSVREARQESIAIPTQDGLGVVTSEPLSEAVTFIRFPIPRDRFVTISELESFLQTANNLSKLAVVRDIQLQAETELRERIAVELEGMGLKEEATRIMWG